LTLTLPPGKYNLYYDAFTYARISGGSTNVQNYTRTILRDNTAAAFLAKTYGSHTVHIQDSTNPLFGQVRITLTDFEVTTTSTYELYFTKDEASAGGSSASRINGQETEFGITVDKTKIFAQRIK
jgi:hypothetical protein